LHSILITAFSYSLHTSDVMMCLSSVGSWCHCHTCMHHTLYQPSKC